MILLSGRVCMISLLLIYDLGTLSRSMQMKTDVYNPDNEGIHSWPYNYISF
jgi:hypothetical protein